MPSDWPIVPPRIWLDARAEPLPLRRPGLFLDRDGIINEDSGFLSDPKAVKLVAGITDLIKRANADGVPVLVITNQSGIDRGLFGWDDFAAVESRIAALLAAAGCVTAATAACPFHPDHSAEPGPEIDHWRKPGPGMILALAEKMNVELSGSWMIGDRLRDMEAARNAGLSAGILVTALDSYPATTDLDGLSGPGFTPHAVASLQDALTLVEKSHLAH